MFSSTIFSLAAVLGLLSYATPGSAMCAHGTHLQRRVMENNGTERTVEVGRFGYIGAQGPTQWINLSPENTVCSIGTQQSPIDLVATTSRVKAGNALVTIPDVETTEFENLGVTVEVVMEGRGGKTRFQGTDFELQQFHFHTPSEHTVSGEYFPLEMHMVHEAADGRLAVVAVQFQLTEDGSTTPLLTSVIENIEDIRTPGTVTDTPMLPFKEFADALNAQDLFTYRGSLTTPPCAEGLLFLITTKPLPLNVATYNRLKSVVGFNARFTQGEVGTPNLLVQQVSLASLARIQTQVTARKRSVDARRLHYHHHH